MVMNRDSRRRTAWLVAIAATGLLAGACATNKKLNQVKTESDEGIGRVNRRVDDVEGQVEANQTRLAEHDTRINSASKTAQEALERAIQAGKLAEGKFLYETVLSDDQVRFGFDKSELSDEAKAALDTFADELKGKNENVFIEIQGHTDSIGTDEYNYELGEARAEAVRRYLSIKGVPLHRMSVISYGEAAPVEDNGTREGRARNRRVVLVVLK